jgi:hypothetical protein
MATVDNAVAANAPLALRRFQNDLPRRRLLLWELKARGITFSAGSRCSPRNRQSVLSGTGEARGVPPKASWSRSSRFRAKMRETVAPSLVSSVCSGCALKLLATNRLQQPYLRLRGIRRVAIQIRSDLSS